MGKVTRQQSKQILRAAGLRATAPRAAVLRLLSDADRPLSHAEVVDALGTDDWDAATLYRNLVKLNEVGLARVASRVGGVTRFAVQEHGTPTHVHPHFACRDCGDVRCLEEAQVSLPPSLTKWREALADAEVQLVGQCPECRSPRTKRRRRQVRTDRS
ncbi:MAG: transcriptional repressor [Myxococcota bacterium]